MLAIVQPILVLSELLIVHTGTIGAYRGAQGSIKSSASHN